MGLATANRNIAAALVIAASIGGDVIVYTLVGALTLPVVLIRARGPGRPPLGCDERAAVASGCTSR